MIYQRKYNNKRNANRVVIIATAESDPRYIRRANMFVQNGYDVIVYNFKRGFYELKYPPEIKKVLLGKISNANYLQRIPHLFKAIYLINKGEKQRIQSSKVVYTFGPDAGLIGSLIKKKNDFLVYEIGDLRNPIPNKNILSKSILKMEKMILKNTDLFVTTSHRFISDCYYHIDRTILKKSIVIENRPSKRLLLLKGGRPQPVRPCFPIKLGFVGFLRYRDCLLPVIKSISRLKGIFEFHVYGQGPLRDEIEKYEMRSDNIFYHGSFKNPEDLSRIYGSLHLNYVVYDNKDLNVRLAIPNKLYESIYFCTPMVVAADTELSKRVLELSIGFVIDPRKKNFAEDFLKKLTPDSIYLASNNSYSQSIESIIEDEQVVFERISNILNRNAT